MKRIVSALGLSALMIVMMGCGTDEKNTASVPVADIMDAIKEQIANDMEESFGEDNLLVDGELQGYIEADLTEKDNEDPMVAFLYEKMELEEEALEEGIVLAPMMNINSNEIIILKAKKQEQVGSLKEALQRELEAQNTTWEMYLPDQYEKVKNNLILTEGTYLIYITYDNPDAIEKIFKEKIN